MLEVVDLACRRGDRQLFSGLSFDLEPGTLLHVRGRNGSGKTTLLRALCGLLTPDEGEIRWNGERQPRLGDDFHADLLYFGHLNGIKSDLTGIENLRVSSTLDGDEVDDERLWTRWSRWAWRASRTCPPRCCPRARRSASPWPGCC